MKIPDPEKSKVQKKLDIKLLKYIFMKHTYEKKFHCLSLVKSWLFNKSTKQRKQFT